MRTDLLLAIGAGTGAVVAASLAKGFTDGVHGTTTAPSELENIALATGTLVTMAAGATLARTPLRAGSPPERRPAYLVDGSMQGFQVAGATMMGSYVAGRAAGTLYALATR